MTQKFHVEAPKAFGAIQLFVILKDRSPLAVAPTPESLQGFQKIGVLFFSLLFQQKVLQSRC